MKKFSSSILRRPRTGSRSSRNSVAACLVEVLPGAQGPQVSLHHRHAGHTLGVSAGVGQPQCDAPVMHHEPDGSAFGIELRKSLCQVVAMDCPGVVEVGFAGTAHPDQVDGHASEPVHESRDHVAPQKRGCGIAVKEDQDRCLRIILVSNGAGVDHSHHGLTDADVVRPPGHECLPKRRLDHYRLPWRGWYPRDPYSLLRPLCSMGGRCDGRRPCGNRRGGPRTTAQPGLGSCRSS